MREDGEWGNGFLGLLTPPGWGQGIHQLSLVQALSFRVLLDLSFFHTGRTPFLFQEHVGAREMGDLTCLGFSKTSQVWKIIRILTLWDLRVDSTEGKSWVVPTRKERVNDRLPNTAEWLPFTIMFGCCCFKSWKSLKLPDTKDWYLNKAREGWRLFWFDHYIFLHCQTELPLCPVENTSGKKKVIQLLKLKPGKISTATLRFEWWSVLIFLSMMAPPTETSSWSASHCQAKRPHHSSGGKFSLEQTAACLDTGHRHFLKGFLFKARQGPSLTFF